MSAESRASVVSTSFFICATAAVDTGAEGDIMLGYAVSLLFDTEDNSDISDTTCAGVEQMGAWVLYEQTENTILP